MPLMTIKFDDLGDVTYEATVHRHGDAAVYDFGDDGRILLQPAYYGQREALAVTVCLGREGGDESGYNLTGLRLDDRVLTGVAVCAGLDMRPRPHTSHRSDYPLAELHDREHERAVTLLSAIAHKYHDLVNGR